MAREIFKFLASLKLAMLLLAVIIVATAFGTYYESTYNADVARRLVYNHWWFDAWLTMLCVNLFCVAAIRYPWKQHQTGFVITHAGIIVLLIGGMIDRHYGIEGSIGLRRGSPPTNVLELRDQEICLYADGKSEPASTPLKVNAQISDSDCKFALNSPDPAIQAEVLDIRPMTDSEDFVPAENGKPAVHVLLRGPKMGQFDFWLIEGDRRELMPGRTIAFLSESPEGSSESTPKQPETIMMARQERHTVFGNNEPTVMTSVGEPTKAKTKLKVDDDGKNPELTLELLDKKFVLKVDDLIEKKTELEGLPWSIFVYGYYPDFKWDSEKKKAYSASKQPNNPAIMFELEGPVVQHTVTPKASSPHGGARGIDPNEQFSFAVFMGAEGKLRYRIFSPNAKERFGDAAIDQAIALDWGKADAEAVPLAFLPKARPIQRWTPVMNASRLSIAKSPTAGALVQVTANGDVKKTWVPMTPPPATYEAVGKPTTDLFTPIEVGGQKLRVTFANRTMPLPFSVQLKKFNAPIQEGMEASMSFMKFESTLAFNGAKDNVRLTSSSQFIGTRYISKDDPMLLIGAVTEQNEKEVKMVFDDGREITIPRSEIVAIEKNTQYIGMNRPTTFPLDASGPWFGTTYKFSQADHRMDRGDAEYSGVQVLRDPGWFPKWFGCVMICFGIFTMFYLKPYMSGRKKWLEEQARAAAKVEVAGKDIVGAEKDKVKKVAPV